MSHSTTEPTDALLRFQQLFDPASINAKQEHGANAIYTPWVIVWLMVYQRINGNATLKQAVSELVRIADQLPANRRIQEETLSANTGAFSRARTRLNGDVADAVADCVFDSLMKAAPPSWQDRRVFILDGTTSKLSSSDKLRAAYPPASNQHGHGVWPIVHWAVAHELASGCAIRPEIGAMYGAKAVGEVELARRLIGRIPAKSVLMADRNFGVFAFFYPAVQAGHDVVTRLTEPRFRSMMKKAKPDGAGRWRLAWKPTAADRKGHPELPTDATITVVLHERPMKDAEGKEKWLWLATTLSADGESVASLYKQRQDVESDIRDVKLALKMEELRGRSEDQLRKELAIGMVSYNLVVQVRRLAAERIHVTPRRLSFTAVWHMVNALLLQPADRTLQDFEKQLERVLRAAAQMKLPNRPGRKYPRTVLPRGRKFPNRPRPTAEETAK